jgi:ribosome maturation factor RimP
MRRTSSDTVRSGDLVARSGEPLFSVKDFEKFTGRKAKVKTSETIDGQANFTGKIASVEGSEIVIEDKTNGTVRIPFDKVAKANLKVDLAEEFKKKR